jgi:uncharacterized protein YdeI (YjbR/CyaY-like superfamily)
MLYSHPFLGGAVPSKPNGFELVDRAGARAAFDALAPSYRKEHVLAIDEAKKPETWAKRVAACVAKVSG